VELESLAERAHPKRTPSYSFRLKSKAGLLVPDLDPMLEALARDAASGLHPSLVARGFQDCLVRVMVRVTMELSEQSKLNRVVLSGGVFNNRYITRKVSLNLRRGGLKVYTHRQVPPGDGGLSLGQAVVAAQAEL